MKSFTFEENPYMFLYVDLLSECNMDCNICYNENLEQKQLKLEQFEDLLKKLPKKVSFRILGGEPTLHPDLFEFIELGRKYRHFMSISSNGLMYSDVDFTQKIAEPAYNNRAVTYGITLSGGLNMDHPAWRIIDNNRECGRVKLFGLRNLLFYGVKNIYLTAIIVRGVNEAVIRELHNFALRYPKQIAGIKFRSVGVSLGNKVETVPYSTREFREELFPKYIGSTDNVSVDGMTDERCEECCFEFSNSGVRVKHLEFDTSGAQNCWKRGQVDFENELIYPFLEYQSKTFGG